MTGGGFWVGKLYRIEISGLRAWALGFRPEQLEQGFRLKILLTRGLAGLRQGLYEGLI